MIKNDVMPPFSGPITEYHNRFNTQEKRREIRTYNKKENRAIRYTRENPVDMTNGYCRGINKSLRPATTAGAYVGNAQRATKRCPRQWPQITEKHRSSDVECIPSRRRV